VDQNSTSCASEEYTVNHPRHNPVEPTKALRVQANGLRGPLYSQTGDISLPD